MLFETIMRFLHIASAVTLIGGVIGWRLAMAGALGPLAPELKTKVGNAMAAAIKPVLLIAMGGVLLSGLYAFMIKSRSVPSTWHMIFGMKILLVLHVFGVGIAATMQNNEKRPRLLTGVAISGLVILALAEGLRYLSTPGL